jgi:hypothetical protein
MGVTGVTACHTSKRIYANFVIMRERLQRDLATLVRYGIQRESVSRGYFGEYLQ